jgi:hypothetical protein
MRAHPLGSLTVGILLCSGALSGQAPPPAPSSAPPRDRPVAETPTGTSRISGRVMAADTGGPLRRAQVRLSAPTARISRLSSTDAEGRYEFPELPAARYTISVSKAGYVSLQFGQQRPFEPGRPLDLASAESAERVDFALPRGSVITGRITDEEGQPLAGVIMQAMRYQYMQGGRRQLVSAGDEMRFYPSFTNDLGEFRLYGLMPGTYIVAARPMGENIVGLSQAGTVGVNRVDTTQAYTITYYPGTANIADAQPMTVGLTQEAVASYSLVSARMARISGTVRDSEGRPAVGANINVRPSGQSAGGMGMYGMAQVLADGTFGLANIAPGEYALEVRPSAPAGQTSAAGAEFASVPITVSEHDLANVAIVTRPGISVSGRAVFEGTARSVGGQPLRVAAFPAEPGQGIFMGVGGPGNGVIGDDGRFEIRGVFGRVLFRAGSLPQPWTVKSVTLNGLDITDVPFDASNATNASGLEIVFSDRESSIAGGAQTAQGDAVNVYRAVILPVALKPGIVATRFVLTAQPDQHGRFQIPRIPPGEYLGVAVESLEQGGEWDPAFRKYIEPFARRFTVKEGQALTLDLPFMQ